MTPIIIYPNYFYQNISANKTLQEALVNPPLKCNNPQKADHNLYLASSARQLASRTKTQQVSKFDQSDHQISRGIVINSNEENIFLLSL